MTTRRWIVQENGPPIAGFQYGSTVASSSGMPDEPQPSDPIRRILRLLKMAHHGILARDAMTYQDGRVHFQVSLGIYSVGHAFSKDQLEDSQACARRLLVELAYRMRRDADQLERDLSEVVAESLEIL